MHRAVWPLFVTAAAVQHSGNTPLLPIREIPAGFSHASFTESISRRRGLSALSYYNRQPPAGGRNSPPPGTRRIPRTAPLKEQVMGNLPVASAPVAAQWVHSPKWVLTHHPREYTGAHAPPHRRARMCPEAPPLPGGAHGHTSLAAYSPDPGAIAPGRRDTPAHSNGGALAWGA